MSQVVIGFLAWITVAVIGAIVGQDARTLAPKLCRSMLTQAAKKLGEEHSERMLEEWLAHLDELDLLTHKLVHASSIYFYGSNRLARELNDNRKNRLFYPILKRAIDITMVILALPVLLTVCIAVALSLYVSGHRIFRSEEYLRSDGKIFNCIFFYVGEPNAKQTKIQSLISRLSLDQLPVLINILNGNMTMVGPMPQQPGFKGSYEGMRPGLVCLDILSRRICPDEQNQIYAKDAGLILDFKCILASLNRSLRYAWRRRP